MYELHSLHLRLHSSQQLWGELLLASIFRKRLASSQNHASHAVRDLFNHVYLFSSTTHTEHGVMRGSAARYGRLLVNTNQSAAFGVKMPEKCCWAARSGTEHGAFDKEVVGLILITNWWSMTWSRFEDSRTELLMESRHNSPETNLTLTSH